MINQNKEDQDFHHLLHFHLKKISVELLILRKFNKKMIQI